MARPKRQGARRSQLVLAAQRVIARHGLDGAKLSRIAGEAGLTSGAVLYYYPDVDELVLSAIRVSMERFYEERARMLEGLEDDPAVRLVRMVEAGLPVSGDDVEVRLFCQMGGAAGSNPLAATLLTSLFDRQVGLYQVVIEQGRARGIFSGSGSPLVAARNIVALEDAYGYRIVAGHPTIDGEAAVELVLDYARTVTAHPLPRAGSRAGAH
ncbi:TetR family transcriptional regulator [Leucobacter weissii]|uniref:TetR family transcriptional regulator n=1 Tax=Leucobacter weissii TaxID=1983706 RepID=A0A939MM48_9MICO|nr:TetR/AcrR family transcriptional regulator [Leucobacter weissii]MBO1902780.1 TetR family transcriptional regulator [Leucobacter weissii]